MLSDWPFCVASFTAIYSALPVVLYAELMPSNSNLVHPSFAIKVIIFLLLKFGKYSLLKMDILSTIIEPDSTRTSVCKPWPQTVRPGNKK